MLIKYNSYKCYKDFAERVEIPVEKLYSFIEIVSEVMSYLLQGIKNEPTIECEFNLEEIELYIRGRFKNKDGIDETYQFRYSGEDINNWMK